MIKSDDKVQFFLVHLENYKVERFFVKLLSCGCSVELLDPRELGQKWQNICFVDSIKNYSNSENTLKLRQIEKVITEYSNSFDFEEKYETGDIDKVLENWQEKYLLDAVHRLNNNSIINKKFLQQKSILKNVKNKWQVTIIKDLKALYTKFEIDTKMHLIKEKIFKVEKDSEVTFACFAILKKDFEKVIDILKDQEIDYEITSWTRKITAINIEKESIYNLHINHLSPRLSKTLIFVYYLLCSFVIHDIFVGLVIIVISLSAYRFELKNKTFLTQVWTGLGAMILGIIGGSFASNMLQVLSMSKYIVVKEISSGLLSFLSLFQIIDWTNQNQNLLINYNLVSQFPTPLNVFTVSFFSISLMIIFLAQVIKVIQDFGSNLLKRAIVRIIFMTTIASLALVLLGYIPIWSGLLLVFGLLIYQPDLQITSKVKTFFVGEFGIFGFIQLLIKSLWFGAVFGVLVLSTWVFNSSNNMIGDNILILLILNLLLSIVLWQITAFLVSKALMVNFVNEVELKSGSLDRKAFNPVVKYKYWKF